jgi:hypothetical protein
LLFVMTFRRVPEVGLPFVRSALNAEQSGRCAPGHGGDECVDLCVELLANQGIARTPPREA